MADWRERQINKKLCQQMPYLIPRKVFTDKIPEDYDYDCIRGEYELPKGWFELFLQMCEDIRQPLIDANYLNEFRFSQIKEKYASMRCYNFGAPKEVQDIISKYEFLSTFVCEECGKPATRISNDGWLEVYCDECAKKKFKDIEDGTEPINFHLDMKREFYQDDKYEEIVIDCSDEWNRYLQFIGERK